MDRQRKRERELSFTCPTTLALHSPSLVLLLFFYFLLSLCVCFACSLDLCCRRRCLRLAMKKSMASAKAHPSSIVHRKSAEEYECTQTHRLRLYSKLFAPKWYRSPVALTYLVLLLLLLLSRLGFTRLARLGVESRIFSALSDKRNQLIVNFSSSATLCCNDKWILSSSRDL